MDGKKEDERDFLHDFATPLGTALYMTDSLLDDLQSRAGTDPDEVLRISQIHEVLEKLRQMLQARRILLKGAKPNAGS